MMEKSAKPVAGQWLIQFDKEVHDHSVDTRQDDPATRIVKCFLQSNDEITAENAADQIDDFLDEEEASELFLWRFYIQVYILARYIPYDDHKQENFVQLLRELHDLPARPCHIWNGCQVLGCLIRSITRILTFY